MAKSKALYKSYLLRLWRDEETGRVRIRLEEVNEEPQIYHFADIETFIGFLLSGPQAHEPYTGAEKNLTGDKQT